MEAEGGLETPFGLESDPGAWGEASFAVFLAKDLTSCVRVCLLLFNFFSLRTGPDLS